jgi:hypothetical protein
MWSSLVVPDKGVTPASCANLNNACWEVHLDVADMESRAGLDNRFGEPDNVQKDLDGKVSSQRIIQGRK